MQYITIGSSWNIFLWRPAILTTQYSINAITPTIGTIFLEYVNSNQPLVNPTIHCLTKWSCWGVGCMVLWWWRGDIVIDRRLGAMAQCNPPSIVFANPLFRLLLDLATHTGCNNDPSSSSSSFCVQLYSFLSDPVSYFGLVVFRPNRDNGQR